MACWIMCNGPLALHHQSHKDITAPAYMCVSLHGEACGGEWLAVKQLLRRSPKAAPTVGCASNHSGICHVGHAAKAAKAGLLAAWCHAHTPQPGVCAARYTRVLPRALYLARCAAPTWCGLVPGVAVCDHKLQKGGAIAAASCRYWHICSQPFAWRRCYLRACVGASIGGWAWGI